MTSVGWSRCGNFLVAGSMDLMVTVYDVANGTQVGQQLGAIAMQHHSHACAVQVVDPWVVGLSQLVAACSC